MAETKITYDSTSDTNALTITLASLATSSTLLVGRESTAISNATNLYSDAILTGQITTGTSPTDNKAIQVWLYTSLKTATSTHTYPSDFSGTDGAVTFGTREEKLPLILLRAIFTNSTSDVKHPIGPISIATACGGSMPLSWGVFVTHNTGVNLNATAGNHWLHYTGVTHTST